MHVIDTASNEVIHTIYLGRAPHEGFFSPDGRELWIAVRGQSYVAVVDWRTSRVVDRIFTEDGPSKVVFSPDGKLAYVNHLRADVLDVIDVASHRIIKRVPIPAAAGGSSDEAISPDGKEIWLGMPSNGRTTAVLNAETYRVEAVLDTGPRTNHPNFVTVDGVDYAYVTVGDLNQTLVYRRSSGAFVCSAPAFSPPGWPPLAGHSPRRATAPGSPPTMRWSAAWTSPASQRPTCPIPLGASAACPARFIPAK